MAGRVLQAKKPVVGRAVPAPMVLAHPAALPVAQHGTGGDGARNFINIPAIRGAAPSIQYKLAIGTRDHPLEREADSVAHAVMGMPISSALPSGARGETELQRGDGRKYAGGGGSESVREVPPSVREVLRSAGHPLAADLGAFMGARFGRDFSRVRLHSGPAAHDSARALGADAYTVGDHIVFNAGQLRPGTQEGRRLIAHELAHVVQQRGSAGAIQRQAAKSPAQPPAPDKAPGLGPARTKYVEDEINAGDFQGAVDSLVHFKAMDKEIDLNSLANKGMKFDSSLTAEDGITEMPRWDYLSTPQKADPPLVRIGPSACSSVSYLYSVIMHEYQHVLWQQSLANQKESQLLHSQGFETPGEVKASVWELMHADVTGLARLPDKVAHIWENLNEAFWKLDGHAQASERPSVERALQKAKFLMKGSQMTLVPFSPPSP